MLLVNSKPIDLTSANDDTQMHRYAQEVNAGIKRLEQDFGDSIEWVRYGYPLITKGLDERGRELERVAEPTSPTRIPLQARVKGKTGLMEIWDYCAGQAELLPNNLWKPTGKRSIMAGHSLMVSLKTDTELAYFLYYKSPLTKVRDNGEYSQWRINDPDAEAKAEGDRKRAELDLDHAIYGVLGEDNKEQLEVIAQSYWINTRGKHNDTIRKELREAVLRGEIKRRSDPTAKGVREFLDEVKVTDSVRLRSLIMIGKGEGKLSCAEDGRWKIGDREIFKVQVYDIQRKEDALCNHLNLAVNRPKLQDLLRDLITREYLDKQDNKTLSWLGRVMNLKVEFKKAEEVKEIVYQAFLS